MDLGFHFRLRILTRDAVAVAGSLEAHVQLFVTTYILESFFLKATFYLQNHS